VSEQLEWIRFRSRFLSRATSSSPASFACFSRRSSGFRDRCLFLLLDLRLPDAQLSLLPVVNRLLRVDGFAPDRPTLMGYRRSQLHQSVLQDPLRHHLDERLGELNDQVVPNFCDCSSERLLATYHLADGLRKVVRDLIAEPLPSPEPRRQFLVV